MTPNPRVGERTQVPGSFSLGSSGGLLPSPQTCNGGLTWFKETCHCRNSTWTQHTGLWWSRARKTLLIQLPFQVCFLAKASPGNKPAAPTLTGGEQCLMPNFSPLCPSSPAWANTWLPWEVYQGTWPLWDVAFWRVQITLQAKAGKRIQSVDTGLAFTGRDRGGDVDGPVCLPRTEGQGTVTSARGSEHTRGVDLLALCQRDWTLQKLL